MRGIIRSRSPGPVACLLFYIEQLAQFGSIVVYKVFCQVFKVSQLKNKVFDMFRHTSQSLC